MKKLHRIALALLLAVVSIGHSQSTRGGTFSLPINDDPQMWPLVGGLYNILVHKALYSTLLRYDPDTLEPVGDLAESYSVSDDGLTYTFKLRDGVTWHDGHPFDAADVAFTIGLWIDPEVPYYLASNFRLIESVEVVDRLTVEVKLSAPQ